MGSHPIELTEGYHPDPDTKSWIKPNPNYKIPNITLHDPGNKRLRVIAIGAGMSGICMAYKIQQQMKNVEFQIYERNADIGGTWFENRYPGCACDVPSHAYTFPWAPNPDWPRFLAPSKDIEVYINKVVDNFDLRKYIKTNHQVAGCWWDAERSKWKVKIELVESKKDWSSTEPLKLIDSFWDECDMLLHATGILNRWDYPKIPGLSKFKGRVLHTAGWPDHYGEEQWKGQRMAVIGSGASSIQTVPTMQPYVKHLDVFVRTPVWFIQIADNFGNNHVYSDEERAYFRANPEKLLAHIKVVEEFFNGRWDHNLMGTEQQKAIKEMTAKRMREMIKDDKLYENIVPDFPVNCRRMTPGDPYMKAIQEDNVDVHFTAATEITEDGVIGADGIERKVDAIVCATGFDVTFRPRFPVVGKNKVDLRDKWNDAAEGYLGLACPDMPNWITFLGPNWPVAQGSIMCALDANGQYAIQCMQKLQQELVRSFCPSQQASDEFNEHVQTWAVDSVWGQPCRSWYKDIETGRVRAIYPGSSLHYRDVLKTPRWEDFDIETSHKNRFAFMGVGRHLAQSEVGKAMGVDRAPYTKMESVDMRIFN
ncbi:hypothetical protein MMC13_000906 [Lambiella insularis]|nr:hypothetical protein [Lambiella insularis]